jgi:hypothetical protein
MSVSSSDTAPFGRLGVYRSTFPGRVDVLHLVRQAVEVAVDLPDHAAADLVAQRSRRRFRRRRGCCRACAPIDDGVIPANSDISMQMQL